MKNKTITRAKKILVSVVTTRGADWKKAISEINNLGLKEVALFLTCLDREKRKEIYALVKESSVRRIPLVHIRNDVTPEELDYFIESYNTEIFCTHSEKEFPFNYDYSKYKNLIVIENVYHSFDENELKNFGGICLDISHLENDRLLNEKRFTDNVKVLEKYPILGNHISAVKKFTYIDRKGETRYSNHDLENLSELDYLKKYPQNYFSPVIAIELENTIKEQLRARDYIEKILSRG